jgi:hypothetical protein
MKLKWPLFAWNALLVLFNAWAFCYTSPMVLKHLRDGDILPQTCGMMPEMQSGPATFAIFAFGISKAPEMLDTVFLALRKRPIIFLHW